MGRGLSNELINLGVLLSGSRFLNNGLRNGAAGGGRDAEQVETYRALLRLVCASRSDFANALEIGAGFGHGARIVQEALDVRPERVDVSWVAAFVARVGGAAQRIAPVETLPYESERFDLIYAVECLVALTKPEDGARECARVLRPGGVFAIAEFRLGSISEAKRRINAIARTIGLDVVAFEDRTEDARESALGAAESRARSLRLIPPPFRNWAFEVATAPGSRRYHQWLDRQRCYYLTVLKKP